MKLCPRPLSSGEDSDAGVVGTDGVPGAPGSPPGIPGGFKFPSGEDGIDGAEGADGIDGALGIDGAVGAFGTCDKIPGDRVESSPRWGVVRSLMPPFGSVVGLTGLSVVGASPRWG